MYNVLWSGSYLPLPGESVDMPQRSNDWQPLFISEHGLPSCWWFLVDHFNCFWRDAGSPVFLVERETAMDRCDSRFSFVNEIFSDYQQKAWRQFRETIEMSHGGIFYIELSGVWQKDLCASIERFHAYTKDCLLPFEISNGHWRKQSTKQRKQACAALVPKTDNLAAALCGHDISNRKLRSLGPGAT
ncbi:hypothetical protein KSS92_10145 [Pseudomonas atacamensis]|uniref:hypothetical protein n=1 Tax=Pseudomonas atacamensis TaxID=2565368 RepID=UPI001C3C7270|nr:hypothetical protein [Pseudomonas atacamensis]QXH74830.1 hypothetical protein KSS92_10145 [Pseudomonas atacamensis]